MEMYKKKKNLKWKPPEMDKSLPDSSDSHRRHHWVNRGTRLPQYKQNKKIVKTLRKKYHFYKKKLNKKTKISILIFVYLRFLNKFVILYTL